MLKTISFQKISSMVILCLLAFCLIFSSLLCGSPLNNNTTIVNILLNITAILSIIINNFIYGKKLKFAKYDILILLISVMYLIPIIFHTYSSISDTFQYFLRYFSIFCIYIILKNLNLTPKVISILLHSIILGAFFIIVLGIDDMSTHFFENLHLLLNSYSSSFASDIRLDSVFEYPNAFAAFINFSCFFTISFFLKTKNKYIKSFYSGMINIEIIAIILSGSRLNIALFLFVLFIFILLLHKKYDTLELIELFFIVFFGSLFYCTNYLTFINYHQYCFVL